jgi:hypothetical protein
MEPCKRVNLCAQRHHIRERVPRRIEFKLVFLFDLGTKQQICPGNRTDKVTYCDGLQFQKQTRNAKRPSDQTVLVGESFGLVSRGRPGRLQVHLDHPSSQPQHQVQRALLLNVVIRQRPPVLQLLSGENQPLLVRRDPFLVLDLGLDVVDRVRGLDFEGDRLSGQGLDEDLHTSPQTENEVEGGLLLDVYEAKGRRGSVAARGMSRGGMGYAL